MGLHRKFPYRRAANHSVVIFRPSAAKQSKVQPPKHFRSRQKQMSVLRQTLSNQRIIARSHHTTEYGWQSSLGKHSLRLCRMQCQKRRPNTKVRRDEAHSKSYQTQAQPPRPHPPRPPPLPKLETIPRPRILVSRTKMTPFGVIPNERSSPLKNVIVRTSSRYIPAELSTPSIQDFSARFAMSLVCEKRRLDA